MWYFFEPAISDCHDVTSELRMPLVTHCSFLRGIPSCLLPPFEYLVLFIQVNWSEVSYGEVLGDKITVNIGVNLYWVYLVVL
jgi:hypothetical protein